MQISAHMNTLIVSVIEQAIVRHGVSLAELEGTVDDAEAIYKMLGIDVVDEVLPDGVFMITDKDGKRRKSFMDQKEYDEWRDGNVTTTYADMTIKPKRDFGSTPYYDAKLRGHFAEGWVIVYATGMYKGANAMPGATWARTKARAAQMIDALRAVGGGLEGQNDHRGVLIVDDRETPEIGQRFHHLLRAINGNKE